MTYRFVTSLDIDACYQRLEEAIDRNMGLYAVRTSRPNAVKDTFEVKMAYYGRHSVTADFFGQLRPFSTGTKITGYIGLRGKVFANFWFFLLLIICLPIAWFGLKTQLWGVAIMAVLALAANFYERRHLKQAIQNHQIYLVNFLEMTLEAMALESIDLEELEAEEERRHIEIEQQLAAVETAAKEQEAYVFYQSLGPEVGPELCRRPNCQRLTIQHSRFCQFHHFENLRGKEGVRLLRAAEFFQVTDKISIYE